MSAPIAFVPDHIHFIATATLNKEPGLSVSRITDWMLRLVKRVEMEVMDGPHVKECADLGNEGITGVVVLSTSHGSVHFWDRVARPFVKMDLYSCKQFLPLDIVDMLHEFDVRVVEYHVFDRNHADDFEDAGNSLRLVDHDRLDFR